MTRGCNLVLLVLTAFLAPACHVHCDDGPQAALLRCELDRLAVLVDTASQGKAQVLVGSGVGANPAAGDAVRPLGYGGLGFITVYPASMPAGLKLPDIGWAKVLGAVRIIVPAAASGSDAKAEAGLYLLANLPDAVARIPFYAADGPTRLALVSLAVDDRGKVTLKQARSVPATREEPKELDFKGSGPGISVRFPGEPLGQVVVELTWKESDGFHNYRFALNLEICFV